MAKSDKESGFAGVRKEEHDKWVKAARMYSVLTGETLDAGIIPVLPEEEDPEAKQQRAKEELERRAKADRELEKAQMEARRTRIQSEIDSGDGPPEGKPGHPIVTDNARAQGVEPDVEDGKDKSRKR